MRKKNEESCTRASTMGKKIHSRWIIANNNGKIWVFFPALIPYNIWGYDAKEATKIHFFFRINYMDQLVERVCNVHVSINSVLFWRAHYHFEVGRWLNDLIFNMFNMFNMFNSSFIPFWMYISLTVGYMLCSSSSIKPSIYLFINRCVWKCIQQPQQQENADYFCHHIKLILLSGEMITFFN